MVTETVRVQEKYLSLFPVALGETSLPVLVLVFVRQLRWLPTPVNVWLTPKRRVGRIRPSKDFENLSRSSIIE